MLLISEEITQDEIFRLLNKHFPNVENHDKFISLGSNWPFLPFTGLKITLFEKENFIELDYEAGFSTKDKETAKNKRTEILGILENEYPFIEFYSDGMGEALSAVMFSARYHISLGSAITSNKIFSETNKFYTACTEARDKYLVPEQQRISPYDEEQLDYIRRLYPYKSMDHIREAHPNRS
ncbi:hypothetical protein [Thiothrix nivea]|uniref:Uncharacterized protein n=1 Tax=Thiothrix nivea (strain ATCC 35100 / DSM 5205 / JP2) TaxID=870187 RepID=A0A656HEE5_THINJ|nr:hypothetical protein [Thiothrix nivea]EIJ35288.1 hypothetical protein Thini_2751 [Thiothrix nivea DSM 5205]